jgi:signal transduction histidine kinase/CheY-like chemotaxis protein
MFISGLLQGLNDIAISKRLYSVIGFIVLWISLCLCTLIFPSDFVPVLTGGISLLIGIICLVLISSVVRSIKTGISDIVTGSGVIKKGDLKQRIDTCAKHELAILAWTFNDLAHHLEQNTNEVESLRINIIQEQQRAEQYERAKQYFLVNMSHEIRTPMNAILGFARYLQDSLKDQEELESVKMIVKSGEHLLATLNDILDFVNIEKGEVGFVCLPFDLNDTVQSIFVLKEATAKLKHIALNYHIDEAIPEAIYGDSVRLAQVLLSLTSNAIKFTEEGGVFISAKAVSDHDDHIIIEFSVRDSGIGIDFEMQETIFNPFEQVTNHMKRKFGGTGIGLSIVKHLIALQDGVIQLKSRPGEGSEFYFRLPFLKTHAGKDLELSNKIESNLIPESEIGKGISVLVVEDNAINQLLVIKLLQKRGYQTTVAENGKIASEKYEVEDFDIILMDLQMPEMDGYETTVYIRNLSSYKKDIPIVAMTAHTIKGEREKCLNIGMNDYISKPFHADELYDKIRKLVNVPVYR